jgi:prepilin-type N-terminal cleavage/methylation domain-containing protein
VLSVRSLQRGFSLVEVVGALVLSSVIAGAGVALFDAARERSTLSREAAAQDASLAALHAFVAGALVHGPAALLPHERRNYDVTPADDGRSLVLPLAGSASSDRRIRLTWDPAIETVRTQRLRGDGTWAPGVVAVTGVSHFRAEAARNVLRLSLRTRSGPLDWMFPIVRSESTR